MFGRALEIYLARRSNWGPTIDSLPTFDLTGLGVSERTVGRRRRNSMRNSAHVLSPCFWHNILTSTNATNNYILFLSIYSCGFDAVPSIGACSASAVVTSSLV